MVTYLLIYTTERCHIIDDFRRTVTRIFTRFVGFLIGEGQPPRRFPCEKWNVPAFSFFCYRKSTIFLSNLEKDIKQNRSTEGCSNSKGS